MSSSAGVLQTALPATRLRAGTIAAAPRARIALLGTGTVGRAVLDRLSSWSDTAFGGALQLVHVANSRIAVSDVEGLCAQQAALAIGTDAGESLAYPRRLGPVPSDLAAATRALGERGCRIVIDATASEAVAEQHVHWLAQGIHVVTACKLGQGTSLARWRSLRGAVAAGAHYGDSATVGAGLPLLRSLRELRAGGDRIHAIAGILSGSLAWLFNHYDGMRPFSALVRQARDAGYTEPDPRDDLSGEDVRRKIVILARVAGFEIEPRDVEVTSLVPRELALLSKDAVDAALPAMDVQLRRRFAEAYKNGQKLRFIARLECDGNGDARARVGLESLPADHPLAGGAGTDNRVAIWSDRYDAQPLVIQGPGAGAVVTAAALLDDALRIVG